MNRTLLLALQFSCAALTEAQAPSFQWARTSTSAEQTQVGRKVVTDPFGSVYLLGENTGKAVFPDHDLDSGSFIAKFRHNGEFLWSRSVPGWIRTMETDGEGYLYVAGNYTGTISVDQYTHVSAGERDFFVSRFDGNGNAVWSKSFGGAGLDDLKDIAVSKDLFVHISAHVTGPLQVGNFAVQDTGFFLSRLSSGSAVQWVVTRPSFSVALWGEFPVRVQHRAAYDLAIDNFGTIYAVGENPVPEDLYTDFFLAKYSPSGYLLSNETKWDTFEHPSGITFDSKNNMYALYNTGSHYLTSVVLTKYNTDLEPVWGRWLGTGYSNFAISSGFALGPDDNPTVAGWMGGDFDSSTDSVTIDSICYPPIGGMDAAIWQFDGKTGKTRWLKRAGGKGTDYTEGICSDKAGNLIIAGTAQYPNWTNPAPDIDTCVYDGVLLPIANKTGQAIVAKIRTSDFEFQFDAAAVQKNAKGRKLIFAPNPGTGLLTMGEETEAGTLTVFDLSGRVVAEQSVNGQTADFSHLQMGLYVVRLSTSEGILTGTYVKE